MDVTLTVQPHRPELRIGAIAADIATLGSDLTWNVRAGLDVALARRWATGAEYRWLDLDYDSGESLDRRIVNLRYSGPLLWVAYSW